MFNHLHSLVKCTYVTFNYLIFQFHTSRWWVHWGNFQIGTYVSQNSTFQLANLWATIKISISAQLSIKSIFSNIIGIGH